MQKHIHQTLSSIPIIPFASTGLVVGAYLAHLLGLWQERGLMGEIAGRVAALALMLAIGWIFSLPIQFVYDRLVPAHCSVCGRNKAYRRWPSIRKYRCRACGADSTA